jgi:hypothetical protein
MPRRSVGRFTTKVAATKSVHSRFYLHMVDFEFISDCLMLSKRKRPIGSSILWSAMLSGAVTTGCLLVIVVLHTFSAHL